MSKIHVKCGDCGKRYGVPDTYTGKRFKCKGCGASIRVAGGRSESGEHAAASEETGRTPSGQGQARGRGASGPRTHSSRTGRGHAAHDMAPKNRVLLLLSGVGCLVLIVGIIYLMATQGTGKKKKKKREAATIEQQEPVADKKPPVKQPEPDDPFGDGKDEPDADEPDRDTPKKDNPKKAAKKAEPEKPKKKAFVLPPIPRVEVGKVAHFDDTPDDVKETIDTKVAVVADPWAGPKASRARRALLEIGRPAVPALLTAMAELDFEEEDSRMAMPGLTMTLQEITKARNSLICRVGMQGGDTEEEKQRREVHKCKHNRAEWFVWWKRWAKK